MANATDEIGHGLALVRGRLRRLAVLKALLSASVTSCLGLTTSLSNASRCLPVVVVMETAQHWAR